jgi:type I restriction enzyme S subunit
VTWYTATGPQLRKWCREIDSRLGGQEGIPLFSVSQTRGVVPRSEISDLEARADDFAKYKVVDKGDIVLNRFNAYRGSLGIAPGIGIVSPDYAVIRTHGASVKYIEYWLKSDEVSNFLKSTMGGLGAQDPDSSGFSRVNVSALLKLSVHIDDVATQKAIAEYLDRETAQIDDLVAKQEQLITTLGERRQVIIRDATTLGVRGPRKTHDSGIPWIGPVVDDWVVAPLKFYANTGAGSGFPLEKQGETGEEITFIKVNALARADSRGMISVRDDTVSRATAKKLGARIYSKNTVVLAKIGAALLLGRIRQLTEDSCIDNNMLAVVPKSNTSSRYLFYSLNLINFERIVNPGAVPSTSETAVGNFKLPFPPLPEQDQIAQFLDYKLGILDATIEKAHDTISALKERRQALISAAVTGKISVGS